MKKIFLLILIASISVFSATLRYDDILIKRGESYKIPFFIDDSQSLKNDSLVFEFSMNYNAFMLNPVSIEDDNISIENFEVSLNNENLRESELTFKFKVNNLSQLNDVSDTLFFLNFEALASPDSISYISLENLLINDNSINIDYQAGKISTENLVFNKKNYVSHIYPNPFNYSANIDLAIYKKAKLEVKIFPIDARSMEYNIDKDIFKVLLYNSAGQELNWKQNNELLEGKYKILLLPKSNYISTGAYQIKIYLNGTEFIKNFMFEN